MTDMPSGPWETVHIDFFGPLPSGEYPIVATDRYSRYPEVEIVHSTKLSAIVPKLDKIFAVHGIPLIVKSDNGPPFNSDEYERYLKALGIEPDNSTPVWPQGNAEVERFMQPLKKLMQTSKIENRYWKQELSRFLLQYRTTPHCTTNVPPAELMFNRTVRGKLPKLKRQNVVNRHEEARDNEQSRKHYNKQYADKRRHVKESKIEVGDSVLVRQERRNKLTANFNETPYTVTYRNKSRVTAQNKDGHMITRNVSHFKQIPKPDSDTDTDDEDYTGTVTNTNIDNNDNNNITHDILRRSNRNRRAPQRYGQPVPSAFVNSITP